MGGKGKGMRFATAGLLAVLAAGSLIPALCLAAAMDTIKLGVIDNIAGPVQPNENKSTLVALQMAREDFEASPDGVKVELYVNSGLKPADAPGVVERMLTGDHVAALVQLGESSAQRPIGAMLAKHGRAGVVVDPDGFGQGAYCDPTTVQWGGGTAVLGSSAAQAVHEAGAKTWFFVSGGDPAAAAAERGARRVLNSAGAKVLGSATYAPGPTGDAGAFLQAAKSGAEAVAFGANGVNLTWALRQAASLGISSRADLVALDMDAPDITGIGADVVRRLFFATPFYPQRNAATAAFAKRFANRSNGQQPTWRDASAYAATMALLRAIQRAGSADGLKVLSALEAGPVNQSLLGHLQVGPGRIATYDTYVLRIASPRETGQIGNTVAQVASIPAKQAFPETTQDRCSTAR